MMRFEIHREVIDRDRGVAEAFTVAMWLDVAEVFAVHADRDPAWSVLTFKGTAGRRSMVVHGEAETVAAAITVEVDGRRRRVRRAAVHPGASGLSRWRAFDARETGDRKSDL